MPKVLNYEFIGPGRILHPDGREFVVDEKNEIWMELKPLLDAGDPGVSIDVWVEPEPTWEVAMAATDRDMPRTMEDIIDACITVLGQPYLDALAPETKARRDAKKALRSQKPA